MLPHLRLLATLILVFITNKYTAFGGYGLSELEMLFYAHVAHPDKVAPSFIDKGNGGKRILILITDGGKGKMEDIIKFCEYITEERIRPAKQPKPGSLVTYENLLDAYSINKEPISLVYDTGRINNVKKYSDMLDRLADDMNDAVKLGLIQKTYSGQRALGRFRASTRNALMGRVVESVYKNDNGVYSKAFGDDFLDKVKKVDQTSLAEVERMYKEIVEKVSFHKIRDILSKLVADGHIANIKAYIKIPKLPSLPPPCKP